MKKALCVLLIVLTGYIENISAQQINLEQTTIDYGTVAQHADGVRYFKFKNTGDKPLMILKAEGSCGCTVPSYPKEPIQPGKEASIKVKYATNRVGKFQKYVTLTTNDKTQVSQRLTIKGEVLAETSSTPEREATFLSK